MYKKIVELLKSHWLVILFLFLGLLIRIYSIQGNSIIFWYDQGRDFVIVQDIVRNGDIKVQGPSASGTNDTIYHGVFYYYLIAPLFILGNGNPLTVAYFLVGLGSFSIILVYILGLKIFKSKNVGLLAAFLESTSFISTNQSNWLSNPQTTTLSVGLFYYFLWNVFFLKPKKRDFIFLGIFLGLSIQAGFYDIFLILPILVAYLRKVYKEKKYLVFKISDILTFIFPLLITVSSMIVTQILMIQRKVLTIDRILSLKTEKIETLIAIKDIFAQYVKLLQDSLVPTGFLLLILFLLIPLYYGWKNTQPKVKEWLLLYLTGPLWLITVQYRNTKHLFFGFELIIYLLFAAGLLHIKNKIFKNVFYIFLLIYIVSNLSAINYWKTSKLQYYSQQKGAFLSEQLALIDKTYELADGKDFTFSSATNPYAINVTWSYLYHWYGKEKYGYLPYFYGMPQAGYFGSGLLPESDTIYPTHFTIIEPDSGIPNSINNNFLNLQDLNSSTPSAVLEFGTLVLQVRDN